MSVQISIVIISYNVEAFLEQCLYSVYKAANNLEIEIFVVDNNSVDNSVEMVKSNFPDIKLICNTENKGFAYACNQAIKVSKGEYTLLLNPDTVIQEGSLLLCKNFMDEHPVSGALGVRMINGKGKFLPESKRSLPTPASAFYKMFGFSTLFPKSKVFGKYQLQYIDENEIHKVEVLSGAFMFIRKNVLDKIGLLDEDFFMYGEDIDLSYRILEANYDNYYFPKTTIIHYKGESTKKSSIKYVKIFYNAMLIFAAKHYKGKKQYLFRIAIYFAIYLRAAISLFKQIVQISFLPILDFLLIYFPYNHIIKLWENFKFAGFNAYSPYFIDLYIPSFILFWLLFIYYFKGYDSGSKIIDLIKAITLGTASILIIYSLLPESYRYSRALILMGAALTFFITATNRLIFRLIKNNGKGFSIFYRKKALIIGSLNNESFNTYPKSLDKEFEILQSIAIGNSKDESLNKLHNLSDIIDVFKIETIIFFLKELEIGDIINCILKTKNKRLEFKIILPTNSLMVGSQSVINLDSIPDFKINLISDPSNRFIKRILDILFAICLIPFTPILFIKNKPSDLLAIFVKIIGGKLTWVSYFPSKTSQAKNLPKLSKGIYNPIIDIDKEVLSDKDLYEINLNYAKNYQIKNDIIVIFKALKRSLKINLPSEIE